MTRGADGSILTRWLARTLSGGTLVAVLGVAVGLGLAAVSGQRLEGGGAGLLDVLRRADAASIVGAGLLALALVPMLELAVAAIAFAREREHRYAVISAGTLLMLVLGLAAALVAPFTGG
ncbi:MAG: DUF1634 domain-containing protein [Candidatus Limnocylindria bacterium]